MLIFIDISSMSTVRRYQNPVKNWIFLLSKIFKFNDPISSGVSFGVSSHAIGTSKAIEISEETGAISSIAIVTTGILTMLITLFF